MVGSLFVATGFSVSNVFSLKTF